MGVVSSASLRARSAMTTSLPSDTGPPASAACVKSRQPPTRPSPGGPPRPARPGQRLCLGKCDDHVRSGRVLPCLQPAQALHLRLWLLSRAGFSPSGSPATPGPAPGLAFTEQRCRHASAIRRDQRHPGPRGGGEKDRSPQRTPWPATHPSTRREVTAGTTYSGDDSGVRLDISSGVGTANRDREV